MNLYWTRDLLDRFFDTLGVSLEDKSTGALVRGIDIGKVEKFLELYLGMQPTSIFRQSSVTFASQMSKESRYSTSSSIDYRSKYNSKEEEFREWISQITTKLQDLGISCDTPDEVLAAFDTKQQGKVAFADFKYTLSML